MTDEQSLIDFVTEQRWFGSKTRTVAHGTVVDSVSLRTDEPRLDLQLVEIIARLQVWYSYSGRPMDATLGIVQEFVRHGSDGWERALDTIGDDYDDFLDSLRRLGEVTGTMHALLGSEPQDPNFSPEEPS